MHKFAKDFCYSTEIYRRQIPFIILSKTAYFYSVKYFSKLKQMFEHPKYQKYQVTFNHNQNKSLMDNACLQSMLGADYVNVL